MKTNPLQNLIIDYWYKAITVAGVFFLAISLIFETRGIKNITALQLSLGTSLIGIGEWINHPLQTKLMPPNIYAPGGGKVSSYKRKPCLLGNLFDILGFIILSLGIYEILYK